MTLNEWILFGQVGSSSKTMWAVISGTLTPKNIDRFNPEIPYDGDDFSRCYKFWKQCDLTDADLAKIKAMLPIWEPFIDNWYKLVSMYENDGKMHKYMQELVTQGRLNAGWVNEGNGCWRFPKKGTTTTTISKGIEMTVTNPL